MFQNSNSLTTLELLFSFPRQDRFILNLLGTDGYEQFKQDDVKWWVPVSLITQSQKEDLPQKKFVSPGKPVAWFSEDITLPDPAKPTEWLLLNEEAVGEFVYSAL